MPWTTIILFLVSFLLSYSQTGDFAKSALIAGGVAAAAYYTIEPTNPDSIFGHVVRDIFDMDNPTTAGSPSDPRTVLETGQETAPQSIPAGNVWTFGESLVETTGETLQSWGPTGTLGVVAGTSLIASDTNWKMWLLLGAGVLLVVS
jgi:hypothetical protein